MAEATFTFRVGEDLKSAFSEAAKADDRTGAQLLRGFMRAIATTKFQTVKLPEDSRVTRPDLP